jgi:hypothetical protein
VPRPERPLDLSSGPIQAFAGELRKLRQDAGNPKYLHMARSSGRSRTALAEAAGGDHLPSWQTVEAYVKACGGDPRLWLPRWEAIRDQARNSNTPGDQISPQTDSTATSTAACPPAIEPAAHQHIRRWIPVSILAVVGLATALAIASIAAHIGGHHGSPSAAPGGAQNQLIAHSSPPNIRVQNKVAVGPTALLEDSTPAYLSTKTIPFCGREHCKLAGTEMHSGVYLPVVCQATGTEITNADFGSAGIGRNPNVATSNRWYRGVWPDGRQGYLSEVYVAPENRGGMNLPRC